MFLFNENEIFTSGPEKNSGQRELYVSNFRKSPCCKLLNWVNCWLGTVFSLSPLLQWPAINACTYSAVSPSLPAK